MKIKIKGIILLLISLIVILNIPSYSNAFSLDDIISAGQSFENAGTSATTIAPTDENLKPLSDMVSNVLLTIAIGVTLISGVMMAINFTIQSVEDKAKIKESMVPWIIGIFIAFGAFGIWKITMSVFYGIL